jgi:hypothetical protein
VSRASRGRDGTFSPSFGYSLYSKSRPIGTFQTVSEGEFSEVRVETRSAHYLLVALLA